MTPTAMKASRRPTCLSTYTRKRRHHIRYQTMRTRIDAIHRERASAATSTTVYTPLP